MSQRLVPSGSVPWVELEPGVRYQLLKADDHGLATLTAFEAGVVGSWHTHPSGEELLMISGEVEIEGARLGPGDYLETPAGARHRVIAKTDALMFVRLPALPVYE